MVKIRMQATVRRYSLIMNAKTAKAIAQWLPFPCLAVTWSSYNDGDDDDYNNDYSSGLCARTMSSLSQLVNGWELQASIGRVAAVDGLVSSAIQLPDEATTRLGHSSRDMISVIFNLAAHNAKNGVCTVVCWFHYGRAQCSVDLRWMARICWAPSFIMWPTKDRHSTESTPLMPSFSVAAPRGHEPPPILPTSSHSRPLSSPHSPSFPASQHIPFPASYCLLTETACQFHTVPALASHNRPYSPW